MFQPVKYPLIVYEICVVIKIHFSLLLESKACHTRVLLILSRWQPENRCFNVHWGLKTKSTAKKEIKKTQKRVV